MIKAKSSQRVIHKTLSEISLVAGVDTDAPILQMLKISVDLQNSSPISQIKTKSHSQISHQSSVTLFKNGINYLKFKYFQ